MQQNLAGKIVVVRNRSQLDNIIASKNYSLQNYAAVQNNAQLLQNDHTYIYNRNMFNVSKKKALEEGIN